jgi:hypothetical protein
MLTHDFIQAAFFINGRLRVQPKLKFDDIVACQITGSHEKDWEWWKEFIGLVINAIPVYHKDKFLFLYEVLPVMEHSRYGFIIGRPIKADSVLVLA